MAEKIQGGGRTTKMEKIIDGLETAENVTSSFATVTGEMVNIQQEIQQLGSTYTELRAAVADKTVEQVQKEDAQKTASASPHADADPTNNPDD